MHVPLDAQSYKPWEGDIERVSRPSRRPGLRTQSAPLAKRSMPSFLGTRSIIPVDNPRRMRVDYQLRQQQRQMEVLNEVVNEQVQAPEEVKQRRGVLEWLQSHNLAFYNAMMAIDQRLLSKVPALGVCAPYF